MGNDNKNSNFSIGCVICASNFMCTDDDDCVVTTCGHLYHKKCLNKWMQSLRELNPTGRDACPDCRTIIHGENGMRPVYLNYTSPDDFDMDVKELKEEKRVNKELTRQMIMVKKEIIGLNQQLQMEKEKSDRLLSRNEKIEHKLMAALATVAKTKVLKPTCSRCEANVKKGRQIMKSKQRHKTIVDAASNNTQKITKQLRSREYTYTL